MEMPSGYAPPVKKRWHDHAWVKWALFALMAVFLVHMFLDGTVVKRVGAGVDPVTGSTYQRTTLKWGTSPPPVKTSSALEQRLTQSGIAFTPSCTWYTFREVNFFGRGVGVGCIPERPAVCELGSLLPAFAATATDAELREFVKVMESGDKSKQRELVRKISDRLASPPAQ